MKMRWWLLGTIAAITGGVLLLKHLVNNNNNPLRFVEAGNEKNFGEIPPEILESEFDGVDFLT
jgi:hypothetical protein